MAAKALSAKHKRFVAEYLKDLNATQAYIRAGYSAKGADVSASRLLGKASVREAIAAGQAKLSEKLEITAEKVLRDIEDTRRNAMATMEWGPALRASELQGKHIGMFVERNETTIIGETIDRPPPETREEWIARRQKELSATSAVQGRAD